MEQTKISPLAQKILDSKEYGDPIFEELFAMKDLEVIEHLKSICGDEIPEGILTQYGKGCWFTRKIINEAPQEMKIEFYDSVIINSFGIHLKREHTPEATLVKFNKHFKL